jgi:putative acetyltransferase
MITIRKEQPTDIEAIYQVNHLTFGQLVEPELVNRLRQSGGLSLSLVAVVNEQIVGHLAFSPVTIESHGIYQQAVGLAPIAVLPSFQRQGIGSLLVTKGIEEMAKLDYALVIVLGHPEYYPRFGFVPTKPYNLTWEREAPEEAFMVKELKPGILSQVKGIVKFHPEFDKL